MRKAEAGCCSPWGWLPSSIEEQRTLDPGFERPVNRGSSQGARPTESRIGTVIFISSRYYLSAKYFSNSPLVIRARWID